MEWVFWVVALVSVGLGLILSKVARDIWWTPLQIKKYFEAQGIGGPPYKLLYGNAPDIVQMAAEESSKPPLSGHNITPRVLPAFHQWGKIHGSGAEEWKERRWNQRLGRSSTRPVIPGSGAEGWKEKRWNQELGRTPTRPVIPGSGAEGRKEKRWNQELGRTPTRPVIPGNGWQP